MSILKEILSGVSKSKSILICDSVEQGGDKIVESFLQKYEKSGTKVLLLVFDEVGSSTFDLGTNSSVTTWRQVATPESWLTPETSCQDLSSQFQSLGSKAVVVIDSLSSALLRFDVDQLFLQLSNLIKNDDVVQLICQIHEDVADPSECKFLTSLFSTVVRVEPPQANYRVPSYNLQHYKPNGKFFTEKRLFFTDEEGNLKIQPLVREEPGKSSNPVLENKPVHDTFSTFRHSLGAEEQKARDNLILPYERMTLDGLPPRGEGKIEYEPEEDDEWDEEDPDEDLEI